MAASKAPIPTDRDRKWILSKIRESAGSVRNAVASGRLAFPSHDYLSKILNGTRRIQREEAVALAALLRVDEGQLYKLLGYPAMGWGSRKIPVVGTVNSQGVVTTGRGGMISAHNGEGANAALRMGDWTLFYIVSDEVSEKDFGKLALIHVGKKIVLGRANKSGKIEKYPSGEILENQNIIKMCPIQWISCV